MGSIAAKLFFKSGVDKKNTIKELEIPLRDHLAKTIDGEETKLLPYMENKKAIIFVNVACACGLTSDHYTQLQELYKKYEKEGLQILGFPCNQFKNQESKIESEIKDYVKNNFNVQFPLFSKIEINGPKTDPIYSYLKKNTPEFNTQDGYKNIPWNFAKFLVNSEGKIVSYYSPQKNPNEMIGDIEKLLH